MYHRTQGFNERDKEIYISLERRLFHEGRVIDSSYLGDQPNLRPNFKAIGFDCLLDINERICQVFVLQFYKSVRLIRSLNGTLSTAFIIRNVEITLRLEEFARILCVPCRGVCVFTPEWAISSLPNGVDSNQDLYPPPYEDPLLIRDALFYQRPPVKMPMVSVTKSADMTLPYGMLLTRLFEHVRVTHPHAFSDDLYLKDHVMIPLFEKRVFRIMLNGKRPCLLTPTPSESSESPSSSSHQEEESDLVNNYTLDPTSYIDQLPPIEGGESLKFKQTKGMFKCLGHFLSNLGKNKNRFHLQQSQFHRYNRTGLAGSTKSICSFLGDRTNVSPLAPRDLVFSTPPSSSLEPHPYLTTLDDLPPRNSNPPPPSLSQGHSQGLS
ncbi:hypothetical protein Tco_1002343 [Tanacetum coccineum]|uniref:Uncharacterized protein n=1 Tax=Tanacetum coccineum TaxID=301880 RepID=A0ABQ5F685_9ASTR